MKKNILFILICFGILSFRIPTREKEKIQLIKTKLQVTVRNDLGNLESGVKVQLFKSEADYKDSKNPVTEAKQTDDKGKVTFEDLEPIVYYMNAEKGALNNFNAGVATEKLTASRLNKLTVIISE